jgi:hypothetical protein
MTLLPRFRRWLGACTPRATVAAGLLLAVVFEVLTCVLRFGLHLQSTRDTRAVGAWTFGLRIHHAYPGVLLLLVAALVPRGSWRALLLLLGIGLVASDLAHHFAVLWPLTGDPQFHVRYSDLAAVR